MTEIDTPTPSDETPGPAVKPKRPRWFVPALVGAGVLVVAAAAGSVAVGVAALAPHTFTAKGAVLIAGSSCDAVPAGYEDISKGAGVTVKDPSGKTIALGELGEGKDVGDSGCAYFFTIKGVPSGLSFYGIEVTHRGLLQYKEAALKKDGAVMSLGG